MFRESIFDFHITPRATQSVALGAGGTTYTLSTILSPYVSSSGNNVLSMTVVLLVSPRSEVRFVGSFYIQSFDLDTSAGSCTGTYEFLWLHSSRPMRTVVVAGRPVSSALRFPV